MASSTHLQFYLARAAQAKAEGETATLAHVRERCFRSEEAWSQLADRAARSEQLKIEQEKLKAAMPSQ
ncbi:MAG: hypothetical protein ACREBK_05040 [Sphingomicrobium sp.]